MKKDLSVQTVREFLLYIPGTGQFLWRKSMKPAGRVNSRGYVQIGFNYKLYAAHRLAWLLMSGKWPEKNVDHIDGNGANNRWFNLREADTSQNGMNRKRSRNNKTGFKGVHYIGYGASIVVKGKKKNLGTFKTAEMAACAYNAAAKKYFGEFARVA